MVSQIVTYRNPLKRKERDIPKDNAPAKKARVVMMKQLVKEHKLFRNRNHRSEPRKYYMVQYMILLQNNFGRVDDIHFE